MGAPGPGSGWLVGVSGYRAMFILAAVIGAVGWGLLRFGVQEPRGEGGGGITLLPRGRLLRVGREVRISFSPPRCEGFMGLDS